MNTEGHGRKFVPRLFNVAGEAPLRNVPVALRDSEGYADPRSWAALFGDASLAQCAPCELVYGPVAQRLGAFFDVSARQAHDIAAAMTFVHRCGPWVVTVAASAQAHRVAREAQIETARAEAGRKSGEARRSR